jgi:hypothetical protein
MKKMILVLAIALLGGCSTPTKLIVNSHPSSAKVFINGNLIGATPVKRELNFDEQSSYLVKVEKDKYLTGTKTLVRDGDKEVITLNFDLKLKPTRLVVKSQPSSATVFINDSPIGKTPVEHQLVFDERSSYLVKIEKYKYIAMTKTIVYDEGMEVITLNVELEPKRHQELIIIDTDPAGAIVTLDDEFLCETPCDLELDDKDPNIRRILKIEKRGFDPRLLQIKYKGDDWREDNFADKYVVHLQPIRTIGEIKKEIGQKPPQQQPTDKTTVISVSPTTIAPTTTVAPNNNNNNVIPSGPVQQQQK